MSGHLRSRGGLDGRADRVEIHRLRRLRERVRAAADRAVHWALPAGTTKPLEISRSVCSKIAQDLSKGQQVPIQRVRGC